MTKRLRRPGTAVPGCDELDIERMRILADKAREYGITYKQLREWIETGERPKKKEKEKGNE